MCIKVKPFFISTISAAITTFEKWGASLRNSGQVRRKASSTVAAMSYGCSASVARTLKGMT